MADLKSPTERFSNRVDNYTKYRPSYPQTVINYFQDHCELNRSSIVADVGSGTGIFTELLLQGGYHVFAVEPNEKMRRAAEDSLSVNPRFRSVKGKAERTGLDSHSIDLVTVAQAFHWFRHEETLLEFRRIIKPSRRIALVWNQRKINNPFQKAYDQMQRIQFTPSSDKAMEDWVRAFAFNVPRRKPSQLRQLQFHCGKPPPAAEPSICTCMGSVLGQRA